MLSPQILASLVFSGRDWFLPLSIALGLALGLLVWSYRAAPPGPARWICPLLKALALLALAFCLLEPLWSGQRVRPGANQLAILVDNSQSLQIKDRGAAESRGKMLRDLLNPQQARWLDLIEENFEVRRYYFDARLQITKDFSELNFEGRASGIGAALASLVERFRGRPLAGIILLTDGNATDLRSAPELSGMPPVYPVVIGNAESIKDISLQQVHTTQTDFEDAPVSVQADVAATGFPGQAVVAQLFDTAGKNVAEQTLRARKEDEQLAFRFQIRPEKHGLTFYRLRVRAKDEISSSESKAPSTEATLANNSAVLVVDRGHGPYRILYVSGRPNWEFKFLNRAVEEDDQLQLSGLIRVAKREPRFNFMGRAGENSNPLFRGFDNQAADETERYDQPVLVRTHDEPELHAGFPRKPEDLFAYHALIVDDLEAEFFTPDQALLIQKFVSERGGGFLMLGGMETFQQGKYQRTPIGDMLPVYLDRVEDSKPPGPLRLALTPEGLLQPWARLRDNEADEKARLQAMAPFQVLNRVRSVKPGASIIATVTDSGGQVYPALTVQRFGRGRTAALTLGDMWHWGLHDAEAHRDMDKSWRQLMRWLVSDVPNRVELSSEPKPNDPNGAMVLQVRVRDEKFQPLDNAAISLRVEPVMSEDGAGSATNGVHLVAEPSAEEPGLYLASYVPRFTGGYRASAWVTNSAGLEVGRSVAGWSTDLVADEFRSLAPNVGLLDSIARRSRGELLRPSQLDSFARSLPHRSAPFMDSWTYPFWHTPVIFAFALSCLVAEWGIRRWKGMP